MAGFNFTLHAQVNIDDYGDIIERRGLEDGGRVQQVLDSEILHHCEPYIPFDTGMLRDSGPLSTEIGSGIIVYDTPYARKQYYENSGGEGLRGRLWFERAKADHLKDWVELVAAESGGTASLL